MASLTLLVSQRARKNSAQLLPLTAATVLSWLSTSKENLVSYIDEDFCFNVTWVPF